MQKPGELDTHHLVTSEERTTPLDGLVPSGVTFNLDTMIPSPTSLVPSGTASTLDTMVPSPTSLVPSGMTFNLDTMVPSPTSLLPSGEILDGLLPSGVDSLLCSSTTIDSMVPSPISPGPYGGTPALDTMLTSSTSLVPLTNTFILLEETLHSLVRCTASGAGCQEEGGKREDNREGEGEGLCLCDSSSSLSSRGMVQNPVETKTCGRCGKMRVVITSYPEGDGTEEECVLSDVQGESDADADIEDTDYRLHEQGSLQRISSRRRKRTRLARQDTTESEDDSGLTHRSQRWNLRLSPKQGHSRTIQEESVSQVRPLVISPPSVVEEQKALLETASSTKGPITSLWESFLSLPLVVILSLPLSLSLVMVIMSFLLPPSRT